MTIVCGTDFSDNARQAEHAASALALRSGVPLKLVHVIAESPLLLSFVPAEAERRAALEARAEQLRARSGADVEAVTLFGVAHEALVEFALKAAAALIVLSSLGDKKQEHWLVGSVAERVAQSSRIPVLIVRDGASIEASMIAERHLRVTVGVELDAISLNALRWVEGLRRLCPCDVSIVQVVWPLAEQARLAIRGPLPLEGLEPELQNQLENDLRTWAGASSGAGQTHFIVSAGWGRVDSQLALLADEASADLLVVGTHQRAWLARAWQGSVSRGAIHFASSNVACIPLPQKLDTELGASSSAAGSGA